MLEESFNFGVVPFLYLLPLNLLRNKSANKYVYKAVNFHLFMILLFLVVYVYTRVVYGKNKNDLPREIRSSSIKEFSVKGCKLLHFQPIQKKRRRILLFPGLNISVRRMIQETCMDVFVNDSEVVCFQIRGIGESDWNVDISAKSMLDDALNVISVFDHMTDQSLDTLFIGYSLGCFVSMQALSHAHIVCKNILLVNGMCSGNTMVSHFKLFAHCLGVNVKNCLSLSNVPITILHAEDDKTIPMTEALEMKQECDLIGRKCNILSCKGTHNNYKLSSETSELLKRL